MSSGLDPRWLRLVGGALIADGLLRTAGRGAGPLAGAAGRWLGPAETALGLAALDRAPLEPAMFYRVVAPLYDWLSPIWRDWLYRDPQVLQDAEIESAVPSGGDVLDLGCGTAAILERLGAIDVRFGTYTGVDLSAAMLARARTKFAGAPGVRFERLDLRVDPLPDGPFDLVVSAWALEHLPEPGAVVAAACTRLRPNGRLVLLFELDGRSPRQWLVRRLWRFFGVRLVPEPEACAWPGLVSLRRFGGPGPAAALAVLAAPTATGG